MVKDFVSGKELIQICSDRNIDISRAMLERECFIFEISEEEVWNKMDQAWNIMKDSATAALNTDLKSVGGLIGGEARKIKERGDKGQAHVCGRVIAKAISYAMGVLEVNASMGLIVAAPTAGSSGVIPGSFLSIKEEMNFTDKDMIKALFNAGAIGYLIALNATVAGAEGGCQAEVGSASAMAASAVTQLMGGSPKQCLSAASSALSNILGLVCDPVGGLVEAPCQQRNAMGVANALISAEIALSGIENIVPFDEMVEVMYHVGSSLPSELRETAKGGMAVAPSACNRCVQ
ncbi:MAG: L-serine ammonia-lyase, iron-sulfur-dependent, subunit alpha [Clostridiales bacterium]|jgi:L-serine dehydratase|nr:L-serine ammonia-lyase, iron-sulfur-dependent, subunit alpha [Clostridiales bacterium]